jgi:hypothetical protein
MAGDVKFTVSAGRDATFKGVAVGAGAKAVAIEGWMAEATQHFDQIFHEIDEAHSIGALTAPQAEILKETAVQAKEVVSGGLETPEEKEKAGFHLGNLLSGFKNFCTDQHRAGVFSCVQALVALCSIPLAVAGMR